MSERSGRGDARRRRRSQRRRGTAPSAETPETTSDDDAPRTPPKKRTGAREDRPNEPTHLKSPKVLERLRARVQAAANEIERLRRENAALTRRVSELETRPAIDADASMLLFDEDPEALQAKVTAFIDAIDHYLATEANRSDANHDAADTE